MAKKKQRKGQVIKVTWTKARDRQYWKELHEVCDQIFQAAADAGWDWTQLAREAHLCYGTVARLGNRKTRWPRYQTVWKLAEATGCRLTVVVPAGEVVGVSAAKRG